jgi:beta-amylase
MTKTMAVMAPLVVGDPAGPDSKEERRAWKKFDKQLAKAKRLGAQAVSTDVWWGLVWKSDGQYDWSYYNKISDHIIKAELNWVAILSTHACGGNVGDTVNVALPEQIWTKLSALVGDPNAGKYVSELGTYSSESVECWATHLVLDDYRAFYVAFQINFASKAEHIAELNISLGPAGELRYPSYDKDNGYPGRGTLQCYSQLARQSFLDSVMAKYGSREGVRQAWGEFENIEPPRDVDAFFAHGDHINTEYGRDFFDWYSGSLLKHGAMVMQAAQDVFWTAGAAFAGINLGAKVPGVHWRIGHWQGDQLVFSDRLAELDAGLIRTRDWNSSSDASHGYSPIIALFRALQTSHESRAIGLVRDLQFAQTAPRVVVHFTCLEMADGKNESLAYQLVRWVGAEAVRQGVEIKGENALNYTLYDSESWVRIRSALALYSGLTMLRITDVVENDVARREFEETCKSLTQNRSLQLNSNVIQFQHCCARLRSIVAGKKQTK